MSIQVHNYDSGHKPEQGQQTWDTAQLQKEFDVQWFSAPFVGVRRKFDGATGTMEFTHSRVYFDFQPEAK